MHFLRFIILGACVMLLSTTATYAESAQRLIVQFNATSTAETALAYAAAVQSTYPEMNIVDFHEHRHRLIVEAPIQDMPSVARQFNTFSSVRFAHPDIQLSRDAQTVPWSMSTTSGVRATTAHDIGVTGEGVIVAVIDSGADLDHEDLASQLWTPENNTCIIYGEVIVGGCPHGGYDFANNDNRPQDDNEHGTHVAGIIAAADNSVGVVGVAPNAQLMILKALDSTGYASYTTIVDAIQFAIDNSAEIINLSLGSMHDAQVPQDLLDVIHAAEDAGILVVAATGNNASPVPYLPSQFDTVLSVGAIQQTLTQFNPETSYDTRLAYFSNWGKVDLVAPGMRINSTTVDGGYSGDSWEGTSMAAPAVSGIAALLLSVHPELTPIDLRFILKTSATDFGMIGVDDMYGAGLVNAEAALTLAASATTKMLVEPAWSENSLDDLGNGYYDTTLIYTGRLPADGISESTVRVQLRSTQGNPIANETLAASLSSGTILTDPLITDDNGIAYITIRTSTTPGIHTLTVSSTDAENSAELLYADTLYIHDNGQPDELETAAWATTRALEDLGIYWTQDAHALPQEATGLNSFSSVIWDAGTRGINIEEQALLIQYLRAGGALSVFGGNMLSTHTYYAEHAGSSTHSIDDLFADYLGVAFVDASAPSTQLVGNGPAGTFEIQSIIDDSDPYAEARTEVIAPRNTGKSVGYFCAHTADAIVHANTGYTAITIGATLDLFEREDRVTLLHFVNATLTNTAIESEAISLSCDNADDGRTQQEHAQASLHTAPEVLSAEEDALSGITAEAQAQTITISWNRDASIDTVYVQANNLASGEIIEDSTTTTSITLTDLAHGSRYIIALTPVSQNETLNSSYLALDIASSTIDTLTLEKKKRKTIRVSTSATPSSSEQIEYALYSAEGELLAQELSSTTTHTFSNLVPRTFYTLSARTVGNDFMSNWSEPLTVKTATDRVTRPTITAVDSTSLTVDWSKPKYSAVKKYRVELYKKTHGVYERIAIKKIKEGVDQKTLSTVFTDLDRHATYRIRVRATFANGDIGTYSKYARIFGW